MANTVATQCTERESVLRGSVLLANSDAEVLWTVGRCLTHAGFRVTACSDGDEALSELRRRHFDVLITDVQLPGVNGLALLDWVVQSGSESKVIVVGGFASASIRALALQSGAMLFLEKPVDPDLIVRILSFSNADCSFSGIVDQIDLFDYVQLMILSRRQAVLDVKCSTGESGRLYISGGAVSHAECCGVEGEQAFFGCLAFDGGTFVSLPWSPPPRTTIGQGGEALLMEAARLKDEAARAGRKVPLSATPMAGSADAFLDGLLAIAEEELVADPFPATLPASASSPAEPGSSGTSAALTPTESRRD